MADRPVGTEETVAPASAADVPSGPASRAARDASGRIRRIVAILVIAGLVALSLPLGFTVVSTETAAEGTKTFDPAAFVDGVWERITTTIDTKAVDIAEVLTAIPVGTDGRVPKSDLIPVTERLGLITVGEAHVYIVRMTGTVKSVDAATSLGTMEVAVDGYPGPVTVQVYIGPRLPSDESSIRDAVGFINFGDFREQTEYGKVAAEINARISTSLADLDRASLVGNKVTVTGAMTIRTFNLLQIDMRKVRVVPLRIEVQ